MINASSNKYVFIFEIAEREEKKKRKEKKSDRLIRKIKSGYTCGCGALPLLAVLMFNVHL